MLATVSAVAGLVLAAAAQPAAAQTPAPPLPPCVPTTAPAAAGPYDATLVTPGSGTLAPTTGQLTLTSSRPTTDPQPTFDVPLSIVIQAPIIDPDGGGIAYYCGRNGDAVSRPGDPLLKRDSPNNFHTYQQRGPATIERFAVDGEGYKSVTLSRQIYVNSGPVPRFTSTPASPPVGTEVVFVSTSHDDNDPADPMRGIKLIEWDLDYTGTFTVDATGATARRTYTSAVDPLVVIRVTDNRDSVRTSTPRQIPVGGQDAPPAPPPPAASGPTGAVTATGGRPSEVAVLGATARGRPCANVIRGTSRADTLAGTAGGDRMLGLGGNDSLSGASGDDCLFGGVGADKLTGGSGRDTLAGGAGADRLTGGSGDDRLTGAAGTDILTGGAGANRYSAGGGSDRINSANGTKETVSCGGGQDVVRADAVDRLRGCERVTRAR